MAGEMIQTYLQGCFLTSRPVHQRSNGTDFRSHACSGNNRQSTAGGDKRTGKYHIGLISRRKPFLIPGSQRTRVLFHAKRLPGERAFIYRQSIDLQQASISRRQISGLQNQHISRDYLGGRNGKGLAVSYHSGLRR